MNWWQSALSTIPAMVFFGTVFMFVTRSIVREEIAKLNGTYLRRELAEQRFKEIETHFDWLRDERKARGNIGD